MKFTRLVQIACALSFATMTPVHAWEISALTGFNFAAPSTSTASVIQPTTGSGGFAVGGLFAAPIAWGFEVESGFIYQNSIYTIQGTSTTTDIKFKEVQVPLLLRYKIDELVGVGVGMYLGIGTAAGVTTETASVNTTHTFSDLNLYSNDYGFLFNVHALIPFYEGFAVALDGRYLLGMEERAKDVSLNSYKTRSIMALAGIAYIF